MSTRLFPSESFRVICWHPKIGLWPWFGKRADDRVAALAARLEFQAVHGFLPVSLGNVRKHVAGMWVRI